MPGAGIAILTEERNPEGFLATTARSPASQVSSEKVEEERHRAVPTVRCSAVG
jgi:hypothetical protein